MGLILANIELVSLASNSIQMSGKSSNFRSGSILHVTTPCVDRVQSCLGSFIGTSVASSIKSSIYIYIYIYTFRYFEMASPCSQCSIKNILLSGPGVILLILAPSQSNPLNTHRIPKIIGCMLYP